LRGRYVEKPKDFKNFTDFFAKILYMPLPDYPSRQLLWTSLLEQAGVERPNPEEIQTLSRISEFYSSGSIVNVVRRTITARRIERLSRKPFSVNELIAPLAKEDMVFIEDDQNMRNWYLKTLGIASKSGTADSKGGGKKGGKKKK